MIIKSYAKINVSLQLINRRADGFHNINTLFQEIDLCDVIEVKKIKYGCQFRSNVNWLKNDSTNLCVRAWQKMSQSYGVDGICINLNKNIPPGSGLGGGSSNAAAIIKAVSRLYNLDLTNDQLESVAAYIGADVPFFIRGGFQLGEGKGDKLRQLTSNISGQILLVFPDFQISTEWAYSNSKKILDEPRDRVNFASLIEGKPIPYKLFENDFELIVVPTYPEIGEIKDALKANSALIANLSGSGSTMFGIFDNEVDIKSAESYFSPSYNTLIANPRSGSA